MKNLIITLLFVLSLSVFSCDYNNAGKKENVQIDANSRVEVVDYHNGVYYFPLTGSYFANALSDFKKKHPDLELTAIAGDGTCGYGADRGYFVNFEIKPTFNNDLAKFTAQHPDLKIAKIYSDKNFYDVMYLAYPKTKEKK